MAAGADIAPGDADDRGGLVLVVGDEEFLVSRAIEQVTAAHRRRDPGADIVERAGAQLEAGEMYELLSPSLFGGGRTVIVRGAQDIPAAVVPAVTSVLADPDEGITLVLQHVGGAKGRALLQAARAAAGRVVLCSKLTRPSEREDFIRSEIRARHATITTDAVTLLVEAVGTDLRELAAVSAQLASDSGGRIDARIVAAYHRGRAEANGYAVADRTVIGDLAGAVENLRWALSTGIPPVLVADALADGVRSVAKALGAGGGSPDSLAVSLGMPAWKVRRAQQQSRGWTDAAVASAMATVATLNADVKGAAVDPAYALETAVRTLVDTRAGGSRRPGGSAAGRRSGPA